jgi:hypothetical protein
MREAWLKEMEREGQLTHQQPNLEPKHTVRGETSETGWPYGTTHDYDCPACIAMGLSFLTSPRSETYWCS